MTILTKDKNFYQSFLSLIWVLILQNLVTFGVNLADNIMLGGYSQTALAGAATVNQIQFFLQQLIFGVGEGLVVLSSQYWGQKRLQPVKSLTNTALLFGLIFGLILTFLVSFFPDEVLSLFTNDSSIIQEGKNYLHILRYTYLIFAITNILLSALRSVETVKIAFYLSMVTLVTNITLNYILIYGNFGAPRLGIRGAATGTLIARILELIIVVWYLRFKDRKLQFRLSNLTSLDKRLTLDFIKVSLPVVMTYGLWGLAVATQNAILGHLDSNAIAANSVASTFFQVLKVVSISAASATSVVIAKAVGSGDLQKIKEYTKTLQVIFLVIGIFTSIALFFIRTPLLTFYTLTPEALAMTHQFILILCVTCIGTAYQMPVLAGIVRGGGDTRFTLYNDLICIWVIMIPLSFLAAFYWKLSPVIVVALLNSDQIFKCLVAVIKVNSYTWIKHLTR